MSREVSVLLHCFTDTKLEFLWVGLQLFSRELVKKVFHSIVSN